jgi:hypothetical protein
MRNPDRALHEAQATLGLAQERLTVALMRESAARGELQWSVADHGRRTSSPVSNAFTSKPTTLTRRTQRHATPLMHHRSRQWERDRAWEREHEHDRDDLKLGR